MFAFGGGGSGCAIARVGDGLRISGVSQKKREEPSPSPTKVYDPFAVVRRRNLIRGCMKGPQPLHKKIVPGDMRGGDGAIFREGNPISRKKNRFLSFFSCARRARLKNAQGVH